MDDDAGGIVVDALDEVSASGSTSGSTSGSVSGSELVATSVVDAIVSPALSTATSAQFRNSSPQPLVKRTLEELFASNRDEHRPQNEPHQALWFQPCAAKSAQ